MPEPTAKPVASLAFANAEKTLALMAQHRVDPIPEHYALWFEYALARNRTLVTAMDAAMLAPGGISHDVNRVLYERFVAGADNAKVTEASAQQAKTLLGEVQKMMQNFGGETASYTEELGRAAETISAETAKEPELQSLVKNIVDTARSLRESGEQMQQRLSDSQAEIEQLKTNLALVTTESQRDHLTGLANRKALDRVLQETTAQAEEDKTPLSLLMLDIDHFKKFNDTYGHLIGDEVLKIVARSLTDSVRGKDTVARYGGEEFAVLLPQTPIGGAMIVAETIRKTIASRDLKRKDTGESYGAITVSIGVAHYVGKQDAPEAFIKRADDALYRSKHAGRNRVTQQVL